MATKEELLVLEVRNFNSFHDKSLVKQEWDKMFDKAEYNIVHGSAGLWSGTTEMIPTILDCSMQTVLDRVAYGEIDILIYKSKVEILVHHHDGTNLYVCTPFKFEDLSKEILVQIMTDSQLVKDFEVFADGDFSKETYIEYIEADRGDINESFNFKAVLELF